MSLIIWGDTERQQFDIVVEPGVGTLRRQMQTLFQSGKTTKAGTHSGSGLAIVKKLVDELQGQISCHSDNASDIASLWSP